MNYKLVESGSTFVLAEEVNSALANGWSLQGGVTTDGTLFVQAMVKAPTAAPAPKPKAPAPKPKTKGKK